MSRKIAALRAGGYTPQQIADAIAGIKPETLGEKVSKLGKVDGYAEYIKENRSDVNAVVLLNQILHITRWKILYS